MSGRGRQAPDRAAPSLGAQDEAHRGHPAGWLIDQYSRSSLGLPLLSPADGRGRLVVWCGWPAGRGGLGRDVKGENWWLFDGLGLGAVAWKTLPITKWTAGRISFTVFTDRLIGGKQSLLNGPKWKVNVRMKRSLCKVEFRTGVSKILYRGGKITQIRETVSSPKYKSSWL